MAIGAISSGCMVFMNDMMQSIYSYLLQILQHSDNPLVFSISAWVVGQCAEWVFDTLNKDEMDTLVNILLARMMQPQGKVQIGAAACVSVLIESGGAKMLPYYDSIIRTMSECFKFYCVGVEARLHRRNATSVCCSAASAISAQRSWTLPESTSTSTRTCCCRPSSPSGTCSATSTRVCSLFWSVSTT